MVVVVVIAVIITILSCDSLVMVMVTVTVIVVAVVVVVVVMHGCSVVAVEVAVKGVIVMDPVVLVNGKISSFSSKGKNNELPFSTFSGLGYRLAVNSWTGNHNHTILTCTSHGFIMALSVVRKSSWPP